MSECCFVSRQCGITNYQKHIFNTDLTDGILEPLHFGRDCISSVNEMFLRLPRADTRKAVMSKLEACLTSTVLCWAFGWICRTFTSNDKLNSCIILVIRGFHSDVFIFSYTTVPDNECFYICSLFLSLSCSKGLVTCILGFLSYLINWVVVTDLGKKVGASHNFELRRIT
jgi:hypothetical protein